MPTNFEMRVHNPQFREHTFCRRRGRDRNLYNALLRIEHNNTTDKRNGAKIVFPKNRMPDDNIIKPCVVIVAILRQFFFVLSLTAANDNAFDSGSFTREYVKIVAKFAARGPTLCNAFQNLYKFARLVRPVPIPSNVRIFAERRTSKMIFDTQFAIVQQLLPVPKLDLGFALGLGFGLVWDLALGLALGLGLDYYSSRFFEASHKIAFAEEDLDDSD
uniref:Uncharacterized protein n=1 Tax=Romanomermis culicivorax TaxID=13658 RepID=A0A915KU97_ROMCU